MREISNFTLHFFEDFENFKKPTEVNLSQISQNVFPG